MSFAPGKVLRDFDGLDVGNDRLIPKEYFLPRGGAGAGKR
jgi:hypothetical protein